MKCAKCKDKGVITITGHRVIIVVGYCECAMGVAKQGLNNATYRGQSIEQKTERVLNKGINLNVDIPKMALDLISTWRQHEKDGQDVADIMQKPTTNQKLRKRIKELAGKLSNSNKWDIKMKSYYKTACADNNKSLNEIARLDGELLKKDNEIESLVNRLMRLEKFVEKQMSDSSNALRKSSCRE